MREANSFYCLVTASRTWDDEAPIFAALDRMAAGAEHGGYARLVVVHGCAKGGDTIADSWVRRWSGDFPVTAERHPALWRKYGKRAGIVRNEQMLIERIDVALAFIRDNSPGATHCAELAADRGIPLRVWRYGVPGVESMDAPQHLADEDVVF